jgi:hypothetical protein
MYIVAHSIRRNDASALCACTVHIRSAARCFLSNRYAQHKGAAFHVANRSADASPGCLTPRRHRPSLLYSWAGHQLITGDSAATEAFMAVYIDTPEQFKSVFSMFHPPTKRLISFLTGIRPIWSTIADKKFGA